MDIRPFTAITRRASLLSLSVSGLSGLAAPRIAAAKKRRKKKGDANKGCKRQAADWTALVTTECAGDQTCLDALACATPLRACNFSAFLTCFLSL